MAWAWPFDPPRHAFGVERLGALRRAVGAERQLLDLGLGLLQEPIAVLLQRLAALVDEDALLELDVAALEPADDRLELLEARSNVMSLMSACEAVAVLMMDHSPMACGKLTRPRP